MYLTRVSCVFCDESRRVSNGYESSKYTCRYIFDATHYYYYREYRVAHFIRA